MALDGTYTGLLASISDWLVRGDLAPVAPDLVTLVDADLNSLTQRLRLQEVDQPLTMVPGSRFLPLPAAYEEPLALWVEWPAGREALTEVIASNLNATNTAGRPYQWCIDGANLGFDRPADQAYSLTFRILAGFGLAAGASPSTYVLSRYPNVYLYGALLKAAPYIKNDDRIPVWRAEYGAAMQAMLAKEGRARSGAPLRVDPALLRRRTFNIFQGC